ncbi:MAG: fibronectin type III domain-containing protein [Gammaproteobacteria bacterium]|nr:fibronectin type III domain-containing protein [Gammaproteobacteria bacterium]
MQWKIARMKESSLYIMRKLLSKKNYSLLGIILFSLPAMASAHLIRIDSTSPFPASVNSTSTTNATYTVVNISTIVLTGIQDQSLLPSGMQLLNTSTCGPTNALAIGASCTLQLQLQAPDHITTLSGYLRERALPALDSVQLPFSVSVTAAPTQYTVTPSGDGNETITPNTQQTVNVGQSQQFTLTANTGFTVSQTVSGTCPVGSWSGNTYNTGAITSDCWVGFSAVNVFPVAEGPSHVTAVPGNNQVIVSWTAPTNTGDGTISSYTVTYGPSSGTTFTTPGCMTNASTTSCTIPNLTNGTSYTFLVKTTTAINGAAETGPASFSSSITPSNELAASPSTLALSGLGSQSTRSLTITNSSLSTITNITASSPSPSLPGNASVDNSSPSACGNVPSLLPGASCTITINPGTTATSSSACTSGTIATASVITVTGNSGLVSIDANVVILGNGCQYQGGYLFSMDDTQGCTTTPCTGSIGGKVVATLDQAQAYPNGIDWSPGGALDSIWGIDDSSTISTPSPNGISNEPAALQLGQLNCDAINNGSCAAQNIFTFYGSSTNYAEGLCQQPIDDSGNTCSGGTSCYTDWYLPSVCEMGPFGSTGINQGTYPRFNNSPICTVSSTNIQNELVDTSILSTFSGYYWSSTEFSGDPQGSAWVQNFNSSGGAQSSPGKNNPPGVRCVRSLTY